MSTFEPPTIASDLWSPDSLEHSEDTHRTGKDKYSTGSKGIDDAFEGGLDFGTVHCITSKPEHGGQDLLLALLASHLLRGSQATATVIDSTLTFDVRRLHQAIRSELGEGEDAMEPLTRLKISKVFDRVGMVEAMTELGEALQSEADVKERVGPHQPTPTPVIEDSEDEEELLEEPEPATAKPETVKAVNPSRLLIVNNISHVMAPIIKNDFTQGQALLTSLMNSITDITRRHNLCTIVFCEAGFKLVPENETLSHFKSCRIKPAVGYGIGYLVDVHIYLHKLFVKKADAESNVEGKHARGNERPSVSVLEIVEDRENVCKGSWACFEYTPHGTLKDVQ
ncbi:Putative P-loop containing nucleoside triphosphate hydrolase [Septoria linicola]|uniref:P-loop containing nucleoside triphosphate hydrolase n=1 Tax=Septoria linicola TaxID=215465 RepID=A0A9Q9ECW4_9PEZI|nr:putative P-loop containing nucleoside triphosphate hydrolase [Septoria linicola]USW47131.1 Putative P-loop containing nucleoside triphosphate hydrolase [Septoria linicola]